MFLTEEDNTWLIEDDVVWLIENVTLIDRKRNSVDERVVDTKTRSWSIALDVVTRTELPELVRMRHRCR